MVKVRWRRASGDIVKLALHQRSKNLFTYFFYRFRNDLVFVRQKETSLRMSVWVHFQIIFAGSSLELLVNSKVCEILNEHLLSRSYIIGHVYTFSGISSF